MPGSHPLLAPYVPTEADPFDSVKAAHLLNRAAFGGTLPEIKQAMERGPVAAVDALLDFPDKGADEIDESKGPDLGFHRGVSAQLPRHRTPLPGENGRRTQNSLRSLHARQFLGA